MTGVKICGLTREQDVRDACVLGAAFVGFNFSSRSPRRVGERGARLAAAVAPGVARVGVFVDESYTDIERAVVEASLDLVQIHRPLLAADVDRFPGRVIAVAHADRVEEIPAPGLLERCAGILFDSPGPAPGGTGTPFDWRVLEGRKWPVPVFLAGGLSPENVAGSIRTARPDAVDVASGVESSPGIKDPDRMRRFFDAVREADEGR